MGNTAKAQEIKPKTPSESNLNHTYVESQEKSTVGRSSLLLVQDSEYAAREVSEDKFVNISDESGGNEQDENVSRIGTAQKFHIKRNWAMSHNTNGIRIKYQLTPIPNMTVSVGQRHRKAAHPTSEAIPWGGNAGTMEN